MSKFINFISEKMLHTNRTADGKEFVNVSFPCAQSKTGYASFGVNMGQILDAKKKELQERIDATKKKNEEDYNSSVEKITSLYEAHKEEWVASIVDRCKEI